MSRLICDLCINSSLENSIRVAKKIKIKSFGREIQILLFAFQIKCIFDVLIIEFLINLRSTYMSEDSSNGEGLAEITFYDFKSISFDVFYEEIFLIFPYSSNNVLNQNILMRSF